MIRVVDLHKSFARQRVLKGVNLDLESGKITTIIGGSGSGKTVLLKHLNALLLPDRGSVLVGGEDIVVSATSANQEAALTWVRYLMSEKAQLFMAQVGVMPTLSALTGSKDLPPYFEVFMKQLETAQARVADPHWSEMDDAINAAFTKILKGEATVQEALDEAAKTIDGLIAAKS